MKSLYFSFISKRQTKANPLLLTKLLAMNHTKCIEKSETYDK